MRFDLCAYILYSVSVARVSNAKVFSLFSSRWFHLLVLREVEGLFTGRVILLWVRFVKMDIRLRMRDVCG